ncbi:MAG TPA: flagellar basal-body MS-ring/collar protein FliF [Oleiagrimonas sp.]|nr:flagellar basal-body MS-ring/collar protein FliF [Oleiagrimonas sp.]
MSDQDARPTASAPRDASRRDGPTPLERVRHWAKSNPLILLLGGSAAVVAIVVALLLWAGGPTYRVLYSNVSTSDGGKIIAALEKRQVPYQLTQGGHVVMVPADKVYKLRMQLAENGLPSTSHVGFKIMDSQPFGISRFAEHVNYLRGLQGELANSIEILKPVAAARVNLALPKDSMFVRKRKPAKASIVLTLQPGRTLSRAQVNAIVHMVTASVRDLTPDHVTVIDQRGHLLTRNGTVAGLDGTQLAYVRKIEDRYRQRIVTILTPILGAGNVHAQVTAQINFNQREATIEHYGPNQGDNPAAVRSKQSNTSWSRDAQGPEGVPGALTNTPPGAAASPIANATAAGNNGNGNGNGDDDNKAPGRRHQQHTVNYEVDHKITHVQHQPGVITRLSTAVVVNYRQQKQDDGSMKAVPLGDATMKQIKALTRQAMGFSTQRGDSLSVVNSVFNTTPVQTPPAQSWWQTLNWVHLLSTLGKYLLILIVVLVLYRLVLRPLKQHYLEQHANRDKAPAPPPANTAPDPTPAPAHRSRRKPPSYDQNKQDLQETAEQDPAMVAMIVHNWMKQHD